MISRRPCVKGYKFARHTAAGRLQSIVHLRYASSRADERRKQFQHAMNRASPRILPRQTQPPPPIRHHAIPTARPNTKFIQSDVQKPDVRKAKQDSQDGFDEDRDVTRYDDLPEEMARSMEEEDPNDELVISGGAAPEGLSRLTDNQRLTLKRFTTNLEKGQRNPRLLRPVIYKWFRIIVNTPPILVLLNKNAWNHLWQIEKSKMPKPQRLFLAEVMQTYGLVMSEEHEIMWLEALFWYGQHEKAVKIWEARVQRADEHPELEPPSLAFYNLGVRMFSAMQRTKQAALVGQLAFEKLGEIDSMTVMPVIVSSLELAETMQLPDRKEEFIEQAKEVYEYAILTDISLKEAQYLRLATSFMEVGDVSMALRVHQDRLKKFKSLVEVSHHRHDEEMKLALLKASRKRDVPITLDALKLLPAQKLNIVLFDNLLSDYVARSDLDTAMKLKFFMKNSGVDMDIDMTNRLMQGFVLESGRKTKMDRLGCAMIEAAIKRQHRQVSEFVLSEMRQIRDDPSPFIHEKSAYARLKSDTESSEEIFESFLATDQPPADKATFSIMLNNYIRLDKSSKVEALLNLQFESGIPFSTYNMNHFLWGFLRNGQFGLLWDTFERLVHDPDTPIIPDAETFRMLWYAQRLRRVRPNRNRGHMPDLRLVFVRMTEHMSHIKLSRTLYNDIIRSFGVCRDVTGMYVFVLAAAKIWNIHPGKYAITQLVLTAGKARADKIYGGSKMPSLRYKNDSLLMDTQWRAQKLFGDWIVPSAAQVLTRAGKLSRGRQRLLKHLRAQGQFDPLARAKLKDLVHRIQVERMSIHDAKNQRWGKHLILEGQVARKQEIREYDDMALPRECDGFLEAATNFILEVRLKTTHNAWQHLEKVARQMGFNGVTHDTNESTVLPEGSPGIEDPSATPAEQKVASS